MKVKFLLPGEILSDSQFEEKQPANSQIITENNEIMAGLELKHNVHHRNLQ